MTRVGRTFPLLVVGALLRLAPAASAHPADNPAHDLAAGVAHPFTGLDHLLAMLAVGLLAARFGGRSLWLLPTLFVAGMVGGGAAALAAGGARVGAVEHGIAASVVVFGLLLVAAGRVPAWSAAIVVPAFAAFHGYAHLAEGVGEAGHGVVGYGLGMIAASAVLHGVGIAVGLLARRLLAEPRASAAGWRVAGGTVAGCGLLLLARTF